MYGGGLRARDVTFFKNFTSRTKFKTYYAYTQNTTTTKNKLNASFNLIKKF